MRRRRMGWLVSESARVGYGRFLVVAFTETNTTPLHIHLVNNNHELDRNPSFGVNHISHMLLIHTLLPLLDSTSQLPRNAGKKGAVRVVMQASQQHKLCPSDVKFESFEECQKDIGGNGK
jgi:hypothetical protein